MATAGTLTASMTANGVTPAGNPVPHAVMKYTFAWTSDASGNVTQPSPLKVCGVIDANSVQIIDGSGSGYSMTVTDEQSKTVFTGSGTAATITQRMVADNINFAITGAGSVTTGTIQMYTRLP